jgi:hypothetical protein
MIDCGVVVNSDMVQAQLVEDRLSRLLTLMAPVPSRKMIVAGAMSVSLTPTLCQGEREIGAHWARLSS